MKPDVSPRNPTHLSLRGREEHGLHSNYRAPPEASSPMEAFVPVGGATALATRACRWQHTACSSSQHRPAAPQRRRRSSVTASAAEEATQQQRQQKLDGSPLPSSAHSGFKSGNVDEFVSWADVEHMCSGLAERLRASDEKYDVVLAVTRGGLVPATLVAQALEMRTVLSATVIFYTDGGDQFYGMAEPRFLSFPAADALAGRSVLVVDDVWDSGRTATAVRLRVQRAEPKSVTIAVIHYKPDQTVIADSTPDFYAEDTDNWIVYPWEMLSPRHSRQR
jgi:uncharacterized protein